MASSTLSLFVEKGPKTGTKLACNLGTVIHIGRVAKGNTLVIKDPSISQKHLTVCLLPKNDRWAVRDLGSSNGTYVNGFLIPPNEPFYLSDGDSIKIGETTSLSVNINALVAKPLVSSKSSLPPRPKMEVMLEDKEREDETSKKGLRGKPRGKFGGKSIKGSSKDRALDSVGVERRVTRSLAKMLENEGDVMIISSSEFVNLKEKVKNQLKEKKGRVAEDVLAVSGENSSSVEEVENNVHNISKEHKVVSEKSQLPGLGENNPMADEAKANMDNMTLGEWFDRMEEYLPKAINKVAEEMIVELTEKAQLFDEHIRRTSDDLIA